MKLRELIDELTRIASESPEADVEFQTIDMASEWFETSNQYFIDARLRSSSSCILTIGPSESIAADYKRVTDRQEQARKR